MGDNSREDAMEKKSLVCFVLFAITGGLTAPMVQDANQLGHQEYNREAVVVLTKFVRDHLASEVQANKEFAKISNIQAEDNAKEIIQYVTDLNRNTIQHVEELNRITTSRFEEALKKLQTTIEGKLRMIADQVETNQGALESLTLDDQADQLVYVEAPVPDLKMPVPDLKMPRPAPPRIFAQDLASGSPAVSGEDSELGPGFPSSSDFEFDPLGPPLGSYDVDDPNML